MKKFYIGFGVAAVLMIGGIVTSMTWNPKVDMVKLGKYFYKTEYYGEEIPNQKGISTKIISGDKTHIKLEININDLKGYLTLNQLMFTENDRSDEEQKILDTYMVNEFTSEDEAKAKGQSVKTLKQEIIKYKWIEEPYNLSITKSDVKLMGEEYRKWENTVINPIVEDNKIPLEGTINLNKNISLEKDRITSQEIYIYGKKGSGTLEVEIESIYK